MHGGYPLLDTQCALQRAHDAWELCEDAVPAGVRDAATVLCNETVGHFSVGREKTQCADLIGVHQRCVGGDIGTENCGKPPLNGQGRFAHSRSHTPLLHQPTSTDDRRTDPRLHAKDGFYKSDVRRETWLH
jgi:hypothetical protein